MTKRLTSVLMIIAILLSLTVFDVCADESAIIIDGLTNSWTCSNPDLSVGKAGSKTEGAKVTAKCRYAGAEGEATVVYTFDVVHPGKYMLTEYVGGVNDTNDTAVSNSISVCHISIDGGEEITPSFQTHSAVAGYLDYANIAVYDIGVDFELSAGEHTLTLRMEETKAASIVGVQYFFKHAILRKLEAPTEIKIETASDYIEIGEDADFKIIGIGSETGMPIELEKDEYTLAIDGDAFSYDDDKLTSAAIGSSEVSVTYNGDTSITCTKSMYTTVNGIYVKSVEYYGGEESLTALTADGTEIAVRVELYNNNPEDKTACISLAGFKGDIMTRPLNMVKEFTIPANSPAVCDTLKLTLNGEDRAETFIWESMSNPCIIGNSAVITK